MLKVKGFRCVEMKPILLCMVMLHEETFIIALYKVTALNVATAKMVGEYPSSFHCNCAVTHKCEKCEPADQLQGVWRMRRPKRSR